MQGEDKMIILDKKEYLRSYRVQQLKIERIRALMFQNPSRIDHYKSTLHRAERLRNKIEDEIEAVDGGILSEILYGKYILRMSLEEIADRLSYSKRQMERLHIKALEKFEILP